MLKIEKTQVVGWEPALRGARNPMNSWAKSDSGDICSCRQKLEDGDSHLPYCLDGFEPRSNEVFIGPNDYDLCKRLIKAGSDHRKFLRMIVVYADITAPLYWWKEYDTYKVGTVANSTSTMHKIHSKPITVYDFSMEDMFVPVLEEEAFVRDIFDRTISDCEMFRQKYLEYKEKAKDKSLSEKERKVYADASQRFWRRLIQLLPSSYLQLRTVEMNYEVLHNMYHAREHHKLIEWHDFCDWVKSLPYSEFITGHWDEVAR